MVVQPSQTAIAGTKKANHQTECLRQYSPPAAGRAGEIFKHQDMRNPANYRQRSSLDSWPANSNARRNWLGESPLDTSKPKQASASAKIPRLRPDLIDVT